MADTLMLATLVELGFDRNKAELALIRTENRGVEDAIDWMMAHGDSDEQDVYRDEGTKGQEDQAASAQNEAMLRLTEEDRLEQLTKLEAKIKERRTLREEEDRKLQIEQEKSRRESGKKIIDVKRKVEVQEMQKIAEQRKREKMEDRLARERVKQLIAQDRADKAAKSKDGDEAGGNVTPQQSIPQPTSQEELPVKKEYSTCRIQIRLSNGSMISSSFDVNDTIAKVREFVVDNRNDGSGSFNLITTFPRKTYSEDDMGITVKEAGFVPSISLVLKKL